MTSPIEQHEWLIQQLAWMAANLQRHLGSDITLLIPDSGVPRILVPVAADSRRRFMLTLGREEGRWLWRWGRGAARWAPHDANAFPKVLRAAQQPRAVS